MTNIVLTAVVTFYCHCSKCNGRSYQPTASGYMPKDGITVAAPAWVPFGTKVHIDGIGVRIVQDRMSKRFPDRWDVFIKTGKGLAYDHQKCLKLGIGKRKITILGTPQSHENKTRTQTPVPP